jgi:hypothetical protein
MSARDAIIQLSRISKLTVRRSSLKNIANGAGAIYCIRKRNNRNICEGQ